MSSQNSLKINGRQLVEITTNRRIKNGASLYSPTSFLSTPASATLLPISPNIPSPAHSAPMPLEEQLNYYFFDKSILRRSLTTKAHALEQQQQGQPCDDQQAYCVLGDAILKTVLTELLIRMGYQTRGDITETKKALESEATLAKIATDIGVSYVIKLNIDEKQQKAYENTSVLAETLAALIGAIYFDGGFQAARQTVRHLFRAAFPEEL